MSGRHSEYRKSVLLREVNKPALDISNPGRFKPHMPFYKCTPGRVTRICSGRCPI